MIKRFNTTGLCVPRKHYMVDISSKLEDIEKLIDEEFYFVINRPRQFGKTTTLNELYKRLKDKYIVIKLDFERMSEDFISTKVFCNSFIESLSRTLGVELKKVETLNNLAYLISDITKDKEIILMIDEVDRISNNQLFVNFLGILRSLYLDREAEVYTTFKSVILVGVYDIKNLKLKFKDDTDTRYNSPWNIAADFDVDMSFNSSEIASLLTEYNNDNKLSFDIEKLSSEIYKFTGGYPFLVSRICQIIDEDILKDNKKNWVCEDIHRAVKILITESNTLFDDLIKNLENNKDLYNYMYKILVLNIPSIYNIDNPVISIGHMFGYLGKDDENNVIVASRIIRERIYNYLISKTETSEMVGYNYKSNFITDDNGLDMEKVLLKFQQFMKENYSTRDKEFLERHGVLLFLAFIKPIINGIGFDYKEVQISEERRLDIVISYNNHKYVIETKIWYGEIAHQKGLIQLKDYLEIEGLDTGYLLIFNFNKGKEYLEKKYSVGDKNIFEVMV